MNLKYLKNKYMEKLRNKLIIQNIFYFYLVVIQVFIRKETYCLLIYI